MSLGLLTRASSGWRRVIGTGSSRGSARSKTVHFKRPVRALADQSGSFLKAGLVQNRHFWAFVRVRAL